MGVGVTVGVGVADGVAGLGVAVGRRVTVGMGVERAVAVGKPASGSSGLGWGVSNCPQARPKIRVRREIARYFMVAHYTTKGVMDRQEARKIKLDRQENHYQVIKNYEL